MKLNSLIKKTHRFLDKNALLIIIALALSYAAYTGYIGIIEHIGLRTNMFDLGVVEQALWQITKGNWNMPTSVYYREYPMLLLHSNLIFFPLALIYALIPSSYTLIILSSLSIGLAGILMFLLAKIELKSPALALSFGILLLINPMVQELTLYDFHVEVFAVPLFILAFLAINRNRLLYWTALLLLISVKEDMPLLVIFMSPFVLVRSSKLQGLLTAVIPAIYLVLVSSFIQRQFGSHTALAAIHRFDYLGDSIGEILFSLATRPQSISFIFLKPGKIDYLIHMFFSGAFFGIFNPLAFLPAIPNIAQNFLDQYGFQSRITGVYYSGIVITAIYVSAIYCYKSLIKRNKGLAKFALGSIIIYAIISTAALSPLPYSFLASPEDYKIIHDRAAFKRISAMIPPNAALATQNNLAPHFIKRETIMQPAWFNGELWNASNLDYILIHTLVPFARSNPELLRTEAINIFPLESDGYKDLILKIFDHPDFGVLAYESGFFLFKKGQPRDMNGDALKEAMEYLDKFRFDLNGRNAALQSSL